MTTANSRTADYPIDPMFLERWSPRAFTSEPITETDLLIQPDRDASLPPHHPRFFLSVLSPLPSS